MKNLFLFLFVISLCYSCSVSECHCDELYQDKDSLYYFADYGDAETNKLVAKYFNAEIKIEQYKKLSDSLTLAIKNQSWEFSRLMGEDENHFQDSIDILLKETEELKSGNEPEAAKKYMKLGSFYYSNGNQAEALKMYFKSLKLAERAGDKKIIARIFFNISTIYTYQGDTEKALAYTLKSLNLFEELGNLKEIMQPILKLSNIYAEAEENEKAMEYMRYAEKIAAEIKDAGSNFALKMARSYNERRKRNDKQALKILENIYKADFQTLRADQQLAVLASLADLYNKIPSPVIEKEILEKLLALDPKNEKYLIRLKVLNGELTREEAMKQIIWKDSLRSREFVKVATKFELKKKYLELKKLKTLNQLQEFQLQQQFAAMKLQRKNIHPTKENNSPFTGTCKSDKGETSFEEGKRKGNWKKL